MSVQDLQELKAQTKGGFWIKPNGEAVIVPRHCGHDEVARNMGYVRSYDDAYEAGCVRISHTCDEEFYVTFYRVTASVEALKTTIAITKIYDDMTRKRVDAEARAWWMYSADPNVSPVKNGEDIEMSQSDSDGVEMKKLLRFLNERLRERQDAIAQETQSVPMQRAA